jgi:hypothetical protein
MAGKGLRQEEKAPSQLFPDTWQGRKEWFLRFFFKLNWVAML